MPFSESYFKNKSKQMASFNNQKVRYISSSTYTENNQRTCSTTQNCLFKILKTITTIPSDQNTIKFQSLSTSQLKDSANDGFLSENSCGVVEKCIHNNECEVMKEDKLLEVQENSESLKLDNDGVSKNSKVENLEEDEKGFMDLLIEAARLIFGEFKEDDEDSDSGSDFKPEMEKRSTVEFHNSGNRTKQLKRKNKNWGVEYVKENVERKCELPVIRSKRGRIQVLPCKYRDSVIEPLTRFTRNRSSVDGGRRQGSLRGNV